MLAHAKKTRPSVPTKSGLMLGLGETGDEVRQVMRDLRAHQVDILTLGQYLRPSLKHLPIIRYIPLEEFAEFKRFGYELGFSHVESGPLVRSSYHADEQSDALVPIITAQVSFSAYGPEICTPGLSLSWAAFADVVPCSLRFGLLH